MYEPSAPAPFTVGYGNGYGQHPVTESPAGPAAGHPGIPVDEPTQSFDVGSLVDASFVDTVAVPVAVVAEQLATPVAAVPTAPVRTSSPWATRALLGALALLLLAGAAVVVLAGRSSSTDLAASSSAARSAGAASNRGTVLDADGNVIAESIESVTTSTPDAPASTLPTPPTSVVVVTAPPATPAPTLPPTTTAPTTTPPTTQPTTTTSTTAPPTTPKITTFSMPTTVSCANPANQTPYIAVSWNTQNTTKVSISIDGPGVYKNYNGSVGSDTVPFACAGPHTYTLTAYAANNTTVTKTLTITQA